MAKITWKGSTLLAPVPPVMVTCGDMEHANIITVAWTGIINTHPPRVSISVRPTRHSYAIIKERGEFIIHLTPASLVRECDYCGIYTGAKVDKFAKTGFHKASASEVACPVIEECPLALECKVIDILPQGTHDLFLAEVVAVDVDESLLNEEGKLCLERADLAAFAHGEYFALGEKLGRFGFSAVKKGKASPPPPQKNRSIPDGSPRKAERHPGESEAGTDAASSKGRTSAPRPPRKGPHSSSGRSHPKGNGKQVPAKKPGGKA